MNYRQCKNDMARLISSPQNAHHQEWKDDIREAASRARRYFLIKLMTEKK